MEILEKKLHYKFKNKFLAATALAHSSFVNENRSPGLSSNERLEFLGDSVLGMVVARYLYENYPDLSEGKMSRMRAEMVCEQSLYEVAKNLDLGAHIRLGKGEEHGGGADRPSILADCVEALIAALYLDGGIEVASEFIQVHILDGMSGKAENKSSDHKTALQEIVQQKSGQVLSYQLLSESGPDHNKTFTAEVLLNGDPIGSGLGRTKKEAEQNAAKSALEKMDI